MVNLFRFPDVGEGVTEGTIVEWLVKEGDEVEEDQDIAQVETDKALVDIPSPESGTILQIRVEEGDKVKVGEVMVVIGEEGEEIPKEETEEVKEEKVEKPVEPEPYEEEREEYREEAEKVKATPRVRKLAEEEGIDLTKIKGTGPAGSITQEDVKKAVEKGKSKTRVKRKHDFYGKIEHMDYEGVRETIGQRLTESRFTAPHATSMDEVDATKLWDLKEDKKEETEDGKLSVLPFIVKAVVKSLQEHPLLNSEFDEENDDIILKKYYNIGIAVATENGLMVPVIKLAEQKDIFDIDDEIRELANSARERTIDLADLKGSTFSITNYGSIGGTFGVPIINPPESAILGVGKIQERPRIRDDEVVPRKILFLSLSFDHRLLDGAEAAKFLNTLKEYLENPETIID